MWWSSSYFSCSNSFYIFNFVIKPSKIKIVVFECCPEGGGFNFLTFNNKCNQCGRNMFFFQFSHFLKKLALPFAHHIVLRPINDQSFFFKKKQWSFSNVNLFNLFNSCYAQEVQKEQSSHSKSDFWMCSPDLPFQQILLYLTRKGKRKAWLLPSLAPSSTHFALSPIIFGAIDYDSFQLPFPTTILFTLLVVP